MQNHEQCHYRGLPARTLVMEIFCRLFARLSLGRLNPKSDTDLLSSCTGKIAQS